MADDADDAEPSDADVEPSAEPSNAEPSDDDADAELSDAEPSDADAKPDSEPSDADVAAEAEDGSASQGSSGSADVSGCNSDESAVAATPKASKAVEKFDVVSITLEEHVASHDFPMHVKTCGACRFWKYRHQWSASFSAKNPVTGKQETWIGCAGGRFAVCFLCSAFKGSRCGPPLACRHGRRFERAGAGRDDDDTIDGARPSGEGSGGDEVAAARRRS